MIYLPITPVGKPRMTQRDKWQQRPAVMRYRAYGDELRLQLPGYEVPDHLQIIFYLPMPKSWSNKKRESMRNRPCKSKPDIDNLLKAFLDHLAPDDAYVYRVEMAKFWADEGGIKIIDAAEPDARN